MHWLCLGSLRVDVKKSERHIQRYIQTHNATPTNWNRVEVALHQLYDDLNEIDSPPKDPSKTKKP